MCNTHKNELNEGQSQVVFYLTAARLAEQDGLKCPFCERILANNQYQEQIREELQTTQKILADYEAELYEKDRQILWLEDSIRRLRSIHPSESEKTFQPGALQ